MTHQNECQLVHMVLRYILMSEVKSSHSNAVHNYTKLNFGNLSSTNAS